MFERITADPAVMGGQPTVRGLRFPVKTIVRMVAQGMSNGEILAEHPDLEAADIRAALEYAAAALDAETYLPLAHTA
ncbi:DUF433 domain-containing protein [Acidipropionibacterium virtanenii]|uniref:DUF433 domain-containing protein n=1 Tax=Acidipropionibacterium virtanenii TaxID=2057246 RepID=A0A344UW68_9ACTN|nr:DUF433 domain-containing protein [Acidipropionibacterium virtanenii]AXE39516.1 hypothetical protein JS278_02375 [Acidipropionibacterium virtanenii]